MTWFEMWSAARIGLVRTWETSRAHFLSMAIAAQLIAIVPAGFAALSGAIVADVEALTKTSDPQFSAVIPWLVLTAVLVLVIGVCEAARRYSQDRLTDEMGVTIASEVLTHAATLDLAFFEQKEKHDILSRAAGYPGQGYLRFVASIFATFTSTVQFCSLFGVMLWIEPRVTLALASITLPFLLFRWRMAKVKFLVSRAKTRKRREASYISSLITGREAIPTTRLFELAQPLLDRFRDSMRELISADRAVYQRMALGQVVQSGGFSLLFLVASGTVASQALAGEIALGSLVTYIASAIAFRGASASLVTSVTDFMQRVLFVRDLHDFMDERPAIVDGPLRPEARAKGRIELEHVSFTYPGTRQPVLRDLALDVEPGETIAIVGPNGAGKTTLVKLIARLYEADAGRVRIDGTDIREFDLGWLRQQIAYVGQVPVRFEATIEDNIAFGNWAQLLGRSEEVAKIAEQAGLGDLIDGAPEGLKTQLGRRFGDFDLSGGQWQLLALSRAMARDAAIVILDEPTSSLDARTEYETFRRFHELSRGRTTLLVSHRFSTVRIADRIFVVDEGRIVETGTHETLVAASGMYANLYSAHRLRYETEAPVESRGA
jgi:ATP-binding cassette subfamily B protein